MAKVVFVVSRVGYTAVQAGLANGSFQCFRNYFDVYCPREFAVHRVVPYVAIGNYYVSLALLMSE